MEEDEGQIEEIQVAVREGLEQAERGEGTSLEEFDQQMRRKYRIPRKSPAARSGRRGAILPA